MATTKTTKATTYEMDLYQPRYSAGLSMDTNDFMVDQDFGSEVSYDSLLSHNDLANAFVWFMFSLKLLYIFSNVFLLLFLIKSFDYVYCRHMTTFDSTLHLVQFCCNIMVVLNVLHLAFRIWYRRRRKRIFIFPSYGIGLQFLIESLSLVSIGCYTLELLDSSFLYGVELFFATLRCYHIIIFYVRATYTNDKNTFLIVLAKFGLIYTFVIHLANCALSLTCSTCNLDDYDKDSYMAMQVPQTLMGSAKSKYSPWQWYYMTLIYTIGSVTHNGANSGQNYREQLVSVLTMICTAAINFLFICDLAFEKYQTFIDQYEYSNRVRLIVKKLADRRIQPEVRQYVQNYYLTYWEQESALKLRDHLQLIPAGLRSDLILDVYWFALSQAQLFQNASIPFRRVITQVMRTESYSGGDLIVGAGHCLDRLFFVARGSVDVLSEEDDESPVLQLGVGACFGDISLVYGLRSRVTVMAHSYVCVHILDKSELWRLKNIRYLWNQCEISKRLDDRLTIAKNVLIHRSAMKTHEERVLFLLQPHLPKESEINIYDVRNAHKSNTFVKPYQSYVISNLIDAGTQDVFFFRTYWPWKLYPSASFLYIWDIIVAISTLLVIYVHPYYIFVKRDFDNLPFLFGNTFVNIIYVVDVLLQFFTIVEKNNTVFTSHWDVFQLRWTQMLFYVDLIAAIPLRLFVLKLDGVTQAVAMSIRLVKFIKLPYYFRRLMVQHIFVKQIYIEIMLHFFFIITLGYIGACVAFLLYCPAEPCVYDTERAYVQRIAAMLLGDEGKGLALYQRLAFLHTYALTVQNVMQMNVVPAHNMLEVWIGVAMCLCGLYMVCYFLGAFSATLIMAKHLEKNYNNVMRDFKEVMQTQHFPAMLRLRVVRYLETQWAWNEGAGQLKLIENTPRNLLNEWYANYYTAQLRKCVLFSLASDEVLKLVAHAVRIVLLPPGEVVIYAGQKVQQLYIIDEGWAEMVYPYSGIRHQFIEPGTSFGLMELLLEQHIGFNVCAYTHLKLIQLTTKDIMHALAKEPVLIEELYDAVEMVQAQMFSVFKRTKFVHRTPLIMQQVARSPAAIFVEHGGQKKDEMLRSQVMAQLMHSTGRVSWFVFPLQRSHPLHREWRMVYNQIGCGPSVQRVLLRRTLLMDGAFIYRWELLRSFIVWAYCVSDIVKYFWWRQYVYIELSLSGAFLTFMLIDMYLQMHLTYYNDDGILVYHPLKTAIHYLKTRFIVDLLGIFPLKELIILQNRRPRADQLSMQINQLLGFNRYLLLFRTRSIVDFENFLGDQKILRFSVYTMFINFPLFTILANILMIISSEFMLIGDLYQQPVVFFRPKNYSWIARSRASDFPERVTFDFFIRALRKVAFDFFTISYENDDVILDENEKSFTICNSILGYFVLGLLIAHVAIHFNAFMQSDRFEREIHSLKKFLRNYRVAKSTVRAFRRHFHNVWRHSRSTSVRLATLSDTLQQDFAAVQYHATLKLIPLVFDQQFERILALHLTQRNYMAHAMIFEKNDIIATVYIVKEGYVRILGVDNSSHVELGKGSVFGNFDDNSMVRAMCGAQCGEHNVSLLAIPTCRFYSIISSKHILAGLQTYIRTENVVYIASRYNLRKCPACCRCGKGAARVNCLQTLLRHRWYNYMIVLYLINAILSYMATCDLMTFSSWWSLTLGYILDICTIAKLLLMLSDRMVAYKPRRVAPSVSRQYTLTLDAMSVIPLEIISFWVDTEEFYQVFRYLHFNRLLRIYCLMEYFSYMDLKTSRYVVLLRMFKLTCYVVTLMWTGMCVHYHALCSPGPVPCRRTDILAANGRDICADQPYMCALFLVTSTLTFRGQMLAFCTRTVKGTLLMILFTTQARILFAIVFGYILEMMQHARWGLIIYNHATGRLFAAIFNAKASNSFLVRCRQYTQKAWTLCRGSNVPELFGQAPTPLVHMAKQQAFGHLLAFNPIFDGCHPDFMRQLIGFLKIRPFFPRDVICHEGDMNGTMYFIYSGRVEVLEMRKHEETVDLLNVGDCFGLIQGLFGTARHVYTFRCESVAQICMLKLKDWRHLLDFFPATRYLIYEHLQHDEIVEPKRISVRDEERVFKVK